jgi:predicted Fe-Mo cluster-binding NifX family protein
MVIDLRVAVPTVGKRGLRDKIDETFSRAKNFTIVTVIDGEVKDVEVLPNNAAGIDQGVGPLVAKMLKDNKVDIVISKRIGPGATSVLDALGLKVVEVESGAKVKDLVTKWLDARSQENS